MARRASDLGAPKTIHQLASEKWAASGLTALHARKLRLKPLPASQVAGLWRGFHEAGALQIPYFDLAGKPTKFYRLRYLEPLPGAAGVVEKPLRYHQLPTMQEVYYPPLVDLDWSGIAQETGVAVAITEGELKAACGSLRGVPTMGLGGVYSFMSSKRGLDFLPSLEEFEWEGRIVYVVYDNDISRKLDVLRAQGALAAALNARGAVVSYVAIPPGPLKGLDDYLVASPEGAYSDLLDKAVPYGESHALWGMNEEVVLIKKLDVVVERKTDLLMFPDSFVRHLYANRFHTKQVEVGSGKTARMVLEKTPTAQTWLQWERRAELWDIAYEPGEPRICEDSWNTWRGWGITKRRPQGLSPKRGDVSPWKWLLDFLFDNDPKARRYFEQWCAYPIQHPGAKLFVACVLWSRVKRLGKSLIAGALQQIYGNNSVSVNSKQLKGNFNSWAKDRQLVVGEEITAGEARIDADYLKDLITNPEVSINEKNKPEYKTANHANYLFLSNHPDAMFLEDGDKRYLIHGIHHNKAAEREKYRWYAAWLKGDGPSHLMHYLLNLDTSGFDPHEHAPETVSKYEMITAGKTDMGLWVQLMLENPAMALKPLKLFRDGCELFTCAELYQAFDPEGRGRARSSVASLGRAFQAAGVRHLNGGQNMATSQGPQRIYAAKNRELWDTRSRKEARDHFDQYHDPTKSGGVK